MKKKLVLFFSVYGSTKKFAEAIAGQTGADLVEIAPVEPYDADRDHYDALADFAKKEHDRDLRPIINNSLDIATYDVIFLGFPMWWYTFPMIIHTLFDQLDFSGKTLVPFNTHMGSGDGGTYRTIRRLAPKATVLEGLPLSMKEAEAGNSSKINAWLTRLNLE